MRCVAFMRAMRAKCTIDGIHFRNIGARFPSVLRFNRGESAGALQKSS